ncbi:hypothetical protein AKJ16_DCAP05678 [Drosera capensis]
MAFQDNGFWIQKDDARLAKGGMIHDTSSRVAPKRAHQWLLEGTQNGLLPNKKQAVGVPSKPFSWDPMSKSLSLGITSSSSAGNSGVVGKGGVVDFQNDFPFGLSISHNVGEPRPSLSYGGNGKVQVSLVQDECPISMGLAYNGGDKTSISTRQSSSFVSIGQSFNCKEGNYLLPGHNTFSKEDVNIHFMGQSVGRTDGSLSASSTYKVNDEIPIGLSNFIGVDSSLSMGRLFDKAGSNIICFGGNNNNDNANASGRLYDISTDQPSVQISDTLDQKGLVDADTVASIDGSAFCSDIRYT